MRTALSTLSSPDALHCPSPLRCCDGFWLGSTRKSSSRMFSSAVCVQRDGNTPPIWFKAGSTATLAARENFGQKTCGHRHRQSWTHVITISGENWSAGSMLPTTTIVSRWWPQSQGTWPHLRPLSSRAPAAGFTLVWRRWSEWRGITLSEKNVIRELCDSDVKMLFSCQIFF